MRLANAKLVYIQILAHLNQKTCACQRNRRCRRIGKLYFLELQQNLSYFGLSGRNHSFNISVSVSGSMHYRNTNSEGTDRFETITFQIEM